MSDKSTGGITTNVPQHWHELPEDVKTALLRRANSDIFWGDVWRRLQWLKGFSTVIIGILALWTLVQTGLAEYIQGVMRND